MAGPIDACELRAGTRTKSGAGCVLQADLPPRDDVLGFGARHNPSVWFKHREFIGDAVTATAAIRAIDAALTFSSVRLPRRFVFDLAAGDPEAGVVASLIWGFPKGGPQGRWRAFAEAFRKADRYAGIIADLRSAGAKVTARDALSLLNALQPGVGFATTSKIAYFAGLQFAEGGALIYDRNVILAIKTSRSDAFARTKALLGTGSSFYHRGLATYDSFVAEAEALARARSVSPDQIEVGLFLSRVDPRSGWGR